MFTGPINNIKWPMTIKWTLALRTTVEFVSHQIDPITLHALQYVTSENYEEEDKSV